MPRNLAAEKDKENRTRLAIEAIQSGEVESVREAAKMFDINRTTLANRMKGMKPRRAAHVNQQRLTEDEEVYIAKAALQMSVWGWPLTIEVLRSFAGHYLRAKRDVTPLGHNWHEGFLGRHPELYLHKSRTLDQQRKDSTLNYEAIRGWFDTVNHIILSYHIAAEDIYNMDEKGLSKGIEDNAKVAISRGQKEISCEQHSNREWVSIIECISTQYSLPPFIIFKGLQIQQSWYDSELHRDTVIAVSPNGRTDHQIALEWLKHFDNHTHKHTQGQYRLLIMDGHASYMTVEFVEFCERHKIVALCLPPHTTHILQPLDVGIFGPLTEAYKEIIGQGAVFGSVRVNNCEFLLNYQKARQNITSNIPGAWRDTGLLPYNPDQVLVRYPPSKPVFTAFTTTTATTTTTTITITTPRPNTSASINQELITQVNQIRDALLAVCPTPQRSSVEFLHRTSVNSLANLAALDLLNQGLDKKEKTSREKTSSNASFSKTKV